MNQRSPYPQILSELVEKCEYKKWRVRLIDDYQREDESVGLTLVVNAIVPDSYHDREIAINHLFPVPPATYDLRSWRRWLFDQILLVEQHEASEFFKIDGKRPFAPHHGPGNNPYTIFEHGTDEDVRTSFRGELKDEDD